jgi:hypothetical protein
VRAFLTVLQQFFSRADDGGGRLSTLTAPHPRGLVGMEPRVYRYRSSRPDDADLRKRLREPAAERRRFGYRRLHLLLKREGVAVNWKKLYRLYREERLTVRKRGGRGQRQRVLQRPGIWHELRSEALRLARTHSTTNSQKILCSVPII